MQAGSEREPDKTFIGDLLQIREEYWTSNDEDDDNEALSQSKTHWDDTRVANLHRYGWVEREGDTIAPLQKYAKTVGAHSNIVPPTVPNSHQTPFDQAPKMKYEKTGTGRFVSRPHKYPSREEAAAQRLIDCEAQLVVLRRLVQHYERRTQEMDVNSNGSLEDNLRQTLEHRDAFQSMAGVLDKRRYQV